jgi:hypothetical protein
MFIKKIPTGFAVVDNGFVIKVFNSLREAVEFISSNR